MVIEGKEEQSAKAFVPILVTLFGIVTEVKAQPTKAHFPILVMLLGITKSSTNSPFKYSLWAEDRGLALSPPKLILHQAARSVIFTEVNL